MLDLLLKNVRLQGGTGLSQVGVRDGLIADAAEEARETIDLGGALLTPASLAIIQASFADTDPEFTLSPDSDGNGLGNATLDNAIALRPRATATRDPSPGPMSRSPTPPRPRRSPS